MIRRPPIVYALSTIDVLIAAGLWLLVTQFGRALVGSDEDLRPVARGWASIFSFLPIALLLWRPVIGRIAIAASFAVWLLSFLHFLDSVNALNWNLPVEILRAGPSGAYILFVWTGFILWPIYFLNVAVLGHSRQSLSAKKQLWLSGFCLLAIAASLIAGLWPLGLA